ncbi:unnamed protein product [Oppiella nova]|uniref:Uncharacterized protein n=1 Tax=Oppiella nova TaxID=334625 RepID=A0A7R9QSP3_9ACAR|nr:unnamed protein product [Oppiella nova]CAG2172979.1 unnamed protein product [Oppiella nova]
MESSHDLEDNSLEFDSRANHSPKAFTVPAMSHMLNTDESVVSEAHNHMDIKSNVVSQMTMDSTTDSLESLKKRVKVLEFKNRKLEEQNSELSVKLSSVEEENEDYKRTNEEFQRSTDEIKRKQWCTNCLKEAQALAHPFKELSSPPTNQMSAKPYDLYCAQWQR